MGILWESYGNSAFPHVRILWEFPQKSCGNGMGMGMKIHFPRQPCKYHVYVLFRLLDMLQFMDVPVGAHMHTRYDKLQQISDTSNRVNVVQFLRI